MPVVELDDRLSAVVGSSAKGLADGLDLHTVGELLRHYPRRYDKRGELTSLLDLVEGDYVTVLAEVQAIRGRKIRDKLHKTDITIRDAAGGTLTMTVFNRLKAVKRLRVGTRGYFAGKVEVFGKTKRFTNPSFDLVDGDGSTTEDYAGALVPIYPVTAEVRMRTITRCVRLALDVTDIEDPVPERVRAARGLIGLADALRRIHRPSDWLDVGAARKRLTFDEAFLLQVALAQRRAAAAAVPAVPRVAGPGGLLAQFDRSLPFRLTAGQQDVGRQLTEDLSRPHPMHRLLQGEVGSGKTLIALRAMLTVVDAGGQAALLAPTEVLAQQHARSITDLLGAFARAGELDGAPGATRVALLTGSLGAAPRRTALEQIRTGAAGIVVGTHALLSEGVEFADLGLVVVDEQHRFGVEQRDALRAKASAPPHVLVMTATPIPRTVAITVYGDLEVSTLRELPVGRAPIRSAVVPVAEQPGWLGRAWERVREAAQAGRQAFVVCPRIGAELDRAELDRATELGRVSGRPERPRDGPGGSDGPGEPDGSDGPLGGDSEAAGQPGAAVLDVLPKLAGGPLAGLRVEPLHGQLSPEVKDQTMRRFAAGEIDVLVATTVIEVGVDVANATVMVVLDADRFGVSQLHQLRGRIGRGEHSGLCLFTTEAPEGSPARERVDAVAATNDGFALSRIDLEQRREGDVLGSSQSGRRSSLRLLQLLKHEDVIVAAREQAIAVVEHDPDLVAHPALAKAVRELVRAQQADYLEKA